VRLAAGKLEWSRDPYRRLQRRYGERPRGLCTPLMGLSRIRSFVCRSLPAYGLARWPRRPRFRTRMLVLMNDRPLARLSWVHPSLTLSPLQSPFVPRCSAGLLGTRRMPTWVSSLFTASPNDVSREGFQGLALPSSGFRNLSTSLRHRLSSLFQHDTAYRVHSRFRDFSLRAATFPFRE